ncbi:hypothetical protein RBB75_07380 [Tunturibacter empetritectus]|uniref:Uncharacterized protein n=1 Tax=Tunturiibacter empetritectus TaxID=3069691 RepID=A0AAU7ZH03_9BACT
MMPPPSDARTFAKRFEPVLLFHPNENMLPVDPKWYLERCSMWRASPAPFDDKANWGEAPQTVFPRVPQVERGNLAALKNEAAGKVWLGALGAGGLVGNRPQGERPRPIEERFFDFAGWDTPVDPPNEITAATINRHAALNAIDYSSPLKGSQPWYYVEFMSNQDLLKFTSTRTPNGLDLFRLVANNAQLSAPSALVYHFLFPLHFEGLEGCEAAGEGANFASFGGEWASMAVLIDSSNTPIFIGLTSRNIGDPSILGDEDQRVGMQVFKWTDAVLGTGGDAHPLLFVSVGTHGLYLTPGPHNVTPFTAGISAGGGSCGAVEKLDDVISGEAVLSPGTPPGTQPPPTWVVVLKLLGLVVGWVVLGIEEAEGWSTFGSTEVDATPNAVSTDQTGTTTFGTILAPAAITVPGFTATRQIDWQVNPFTAPAPDGRKYDFVIDRTSQVWWVPRTESAGWDGRWGPRVTNDPNNRRAGMRCPDFMEMFLEGIAVTLNK